MRFKAILLEYLNGVKRQQDLSQVDNNALVPSRFGSWRKTAGKIARERWKKKDYDSFSRKQLYVGVV
jgi:hypothetical protein